jgi:hypothetical protein
MSHSKIRLLYQARLSAWETDQGLRVAYQNVQFDPEDGETYLRAFLLPAGTDSNTLAGDHKAYTGVFQVSIVTPSGDGPTRAEALADDIADLFPLYLRLSDGDLEVMVLTPVEPSPGIVEGSNYMVAASFQYRADTE